MTDATKLSDEQLKNLIDNHRRAGATDRPLYASAIDEFNRRHGGELDLTTTLRYLRAAASEGRFVSYGELAAANGVSWDKVRYPMNTHLWVLVDYAKRRGWPMLSAIIVNKKHVATGEMDEATLSGFIEAARGLGHPVTGAVTFLKQQQEQCFEWGRAENDGRL
jgi:hypothetical protein